MALITGPDAAVLSIHEVLRFWKQRGVVFGLSKDGAISILTESRTDMHEAQRYRSQNAEALRRYLAFVHGRDPDDAMRHLAFAWSLRDKKVAAMTETQTEYVPAKVAPLEREKTGLLRALETNKREGDELRMKLTEVNNKIAETMGDASGG